MSGDAGSAALLYRQSVRPSSGEGDSRSRLLPRALLGLLQEAAGRDASARGAGMERLLEQGLAWMLVRLVVQIERWPAVAEECVLSSWPTSFGGATAEREFALESGAEPSEGRTRILEATSRWAVVDLAARRAVRVPAFVRSLPVAPRGVSVPFPPAPVRPADAPPLGEVALTVDGADLDRLGHASNVRYIDWALAALPHGWDEGRELSHMDLTFRREAKGGDRLRSRAYLLDEDLVGHEIEPEAGQDAGEAWARVVTRWRRCA